MSALNYRNTVKVYRRSHLGRVTETPALKGLDLDIPDGEIFGLLGLNGAGKTTTIKLALGLLRPTSGEVSVSGRPAGSQEALRKVGYLPELPTIYSYMSAREALRFYGRLSGVPGAELDARVATVLDRVGLGPHKDRTIASFSKGMLQKVGLAQAIIHEPAVLLLDEPVSGLDPLAVAEMRELFQALNAGGTTLFFSSHSISEVERLCHRVAVLVDGRLARLLSQEEWAGEPGRLERIFVETVRGAAGGAAGGGLS